MKIVCIKMNNGDELVADKVENEELGEEMIIRKVRQLIMSNNGSAGLIPWMITNPNGTFNVNKTSYATVCDAPMDVATAYTESVTGIALNNGKIVVH